MAVIKGRFVRLFRCLFVLFFFFFFLFLRSFLGCLFIYLFARSLACFLVCLLGCSFLSLFLFYLCACFLSLFWLKGLTRRCSSLHPFFIPVQITNGVHPPPSLPTLGPGLLPPSLTPGGQGHEAICGVRPGPKVCVGLGKSDLWGEARPESVRRSREKRSVG